MLLRRVSLKSTVSWVTTPIWERKRRQGGIAHVATINEQASRGDVKKTRNQVDQRALSRAARSHHRHYFSRLDFQIDVAQDLARFVAVSFVGEAHIFETNAAGESAATAWRPAFPGHRLRYP